MTPRILLRIAAALLFSGLARAQATVFEGPPGGQGNVAVYAFPGAAAVRPPELQGIVLVPVDAAGRSDFTQFLPGQPRLKSDLPLASRVLLPAGRGCLYRYRRDDLGGAAFGYFVVQSGGLATFLFETSGTGPFGSDDPTPNPVAISDAGDSMLVATTPAAGGDVYEVRFLDASVRLLTGGNAPLEVLPQGLALLPKWAVALTTSGPMRLVRGGTASPYVDRRMVLVGGPHGPFAGLPFFGDGIAKSADGSTAAIIAGDSADSAHVFSFGPSGLPLCINVDAAAIADPGFGTQAGPTLALSPDGRRAAWKTVGVSGECFSRRVAATLPEAEYQITGNANFSDTLNDTGVIAFFGTDSLVTVVGETNGVGGVEKGDLYLTTFPAGGGTPQIQNLTNTSGDSTLPFLAKGDLETSDGIYLAPDKSSVFYFIPGSSGRGSLFRLNTGSGNIQLVRDGVAFVNFVERAGANFMVGFLHDSPSRRELLRVPFNTAQTTESLGIFGASQDFMRLAAMPSGRFAAAVGTPSAQQLGQILLPSGAGDVLTNPSVYGPVMGYDGAGAVLASAQVSSKVVFLSWKIGLGIGIYGSAPEGLVLPAN